MSDQISIKSSATTSLNGSATTSPNGSTSSIPAAVSNSRQRGVKLDMTKIKRERANELSKKMKKMKKKNSVICCMQYTMFFNCTRCIDRIQYYTQLNGSKLRVFSNRFLSIRNKLIKY